MQMKTNLTESFAMDFDATFRTHKDLFHMLDVDSTIRRDDFDLTDVAVSIGVQHLNKKRAKSFKRGLFRKRNAVIDSSVLFDKKKFMDSLVFANPADKQGRRNAMCEMQEEERKIIMYSIKFFLSYKYMRNIAIC